MDKIRSKINASRPRKDEGGSFEVTRSDKSILASVKYVLTTGIKAFDESTGGFPFGRITEVYGLDGCLTGDTNIRYTVMKNGEIQNSKGGTLEHLWHRWNGVEKSGKGYYQRKSTKDSDFYILSMDHDGFIVKNRVADVVKTGTKACFLLCTDSGRKIKATSDHKFFTGCKYQPLSELKVGDEVVVHNNTRYKNDGKRHLPYLATTVKWHYSKTIKPRIIHGNTYYVLPLHRMAYEANLNGLELDEYRELLNSGITSLPHGFKTIPPNHDVHHVDENRHNNHPDNLELIEHGDHAILHSDKNRGKWVVTTEKIVSIDPAGDHDTFDVKCYVPHNNYVANGFVVHNCGKTGIAIRASIRAQLRHIYEKIREDGVTALRRVPEDSDVTVLYIDNEHSLEEDDKTILYDEDNPTAPGTKIKCLTAECDTVSQLFKIIDLTLDCIKKEEEESGRKQFVVVVVDTIASTSSNEEMTAEWGKVDYARQPKQLREGFRKMTRKLARQNVCMICLNQVSDNYAAAQAGGHKPKYNTPQDEDFATFGGRALKYYASLRVFMFKMKGKMVLIPKSKFADGYVIGFRTTKNRIIKPGREGRLSLIFNRGYNDRLSIMESLLFLGFCELSDKGEIRIRYRANGVVPSTYGPKAEDGKTLQQQDEDDERDTDPKVPCKGAWIQHYREHQEDIDRLWDAAVQYMFASEGNAGAEATPGLVDVDEDEIQDEDEEALNA